MTDSRLVGRALLALAGIGLLVGGAYGVATGVASLGTCGTSQLVADGTEATDEAVPFGNLSADQRALAEQAIAGESPTVAGSDEWPWFEQLLVVQYEGEYYEFYTVTTECPFPTEAYVVAGGVGVLLGLGALIPAGRTVIRARRSE